MQKKIYFKNFQFKTQNSQTQTPSQLPVSHVVLLIGEQNAQLALQTKDFETSLDLTSEAVTVKCFNKEEDITLDKPSGKFQLKVSKLKLKGRIQLGILDQKKKKLGNICFSYEMRAPVQIQPQPQPLPSKNFNIILKNLRCTFFKDIEFIFKKQPIISITSNEDKFTAEPKQNIDKRELTWSQSFKIKIHEETAINFGILDKNDNNAVISSYTCYSDQFGEGEGYKKLCIFDKCFDPLGQICLDYELEDSDGKPIPKPQTKKKIKQVTQIKISTLQCSSKSMSNMYYKICFGSGTIRTSKLIQKGNNFVLDLNENFYAFENENRVLIALFQQSIIKDTFIGHGEILLKNITDGENQLKINSQEYTLTFQAKKAKVYYRILQIYDIDITVHISTDVIGDSDMYLVGRIGGSVCQTEVITGKHANWKQKLWLVYTTEQYLKLTLMDEDVFKDDTMYEVEVKISQFKKEGGDMKVKLVESDQSKTGWILFKYRMIVSEGESWRGGGGGYGYGGGYMNQVDDDGLYEFQIELENTPGGSDGPGNSNDKDKGKNVDRKQPIQQKKSDGSTNRSKEDSKKQKQEEKIDPPTHPQSDDNIKKQTTEEKQFDEPKVEVKEQVEKQKDEPVQEKLGEPQREEQKEKQSTQRQKQLKEIGGNNGDGDGDGEKQNPNGQGPEIQPERQKGSQMNTGSERGENQKEVSINSGQPTGRSKSSRFKEKGGSKEKESDKSPQKGPRLQSINRRHKLRIYEEEIQTRNRGFSIPKGKRFVGEKYSGEPAYYIGSSFDPKSKKGVGFGFGNKQMLPHWKVRNMKENPGPGFYDYDSDPKLKIRGPTFGLPWSYYEKVRLPEEGPVPKKKETKKKVRMQIKEFPRLNNCRA